MLHCNSVSSPWQAGVGGRTRRDNSHEEEMKDLEVCEKRNKQQ